MTKEEALRKIEELKAFIQNEDAVGYKDDPIFLLSLEEFEKYKDKIPKFKCRWWLRSSNYYSNYVDTIDANFLVDHYGNSVYYDNFCVCPVIKYEIHSSYLHISDIWPDVIIYNDCPFKIIDKEKHLAIAMMPITVRRFNKFDNNYDKSEIRQYLLDWYERKVW